jgi:hypothetical protein
VLILSKEKRNLPEGHDSFSSVKSTEKSVRVSLFTPLNSVGLFIWGVCLFTPLNAKPIYLGRLIKIQFFVPIRLPCEIFIPLNLSVFCLTEAFQ